MSAASSYPCDCCGYRTLSLSPNGSTYQLCEVCGWEDSGPELFNGPWSDGSNRLHLIDAQDCFARHGFCDQVWSDSVRSPSLADARATDWETLSETRIRLANQLPTLFDNLDDTLALQMYLPLPPAKPHGDHGHWGRWEHYLIEFEQTVPFAHYGDFRRYLPLLIQVALEPRTDELDRLREMAEVRDLLASSDFREQIDEYSRQQKRYLAAVLTFVANPWLAGPNQELQRAMNDYWGR